MPTPGTNKGKNKKKQVLSFNFPPKPSANTSHPHPLSQRTELTLKQNPLLSILSFPCTVGPSA